MSARAEPPPTDVWHGRKVTLADVLGALSDIRKEFARQEAGDDAHAHPRSCVMTLVAIVSSEEEERLAQTTARRIAAEHPAQTIVVRERRDMHGSQIDAWIRTDVHRPQNGCALQCELLTLHVHGAAGEHLAAMLDPLLVSGVPTYLWWVGTPAFGKGDLEDALPVCDSLIVDSARFTDPPHGIRGLARLSTSVHRQLGVADFQWSRLRMWREMVAQFFSPSERRAFLSGISEVGIEYSAEDGGNRIAPALITGWLASSLGWKLRRGAAGGGGSSALHFGSGHGHTVEVHFRPAAGSGTGPGRLSAVRLAGAAAGTTFSLSVEVDPPRRRAPEETSYRPIHSSGGDDDAGHELASRRAERHREVLNSRLDSLHHTASGEPPGESRPRNPMVFSGERRQPARPSRLLLTSIQIGEGRTLRHVQHLEPEDDAVLLVDLLTAGTRDAVFQRSLAATAALAGAL